MAPTVPPKPAHPPQVGSDPFADAGLGVPLRLQRLQQEEQVSIADPELSLDVVTEVMRFLRVEVEDLLLMNRTPLLAVIVGSGRQAVTAAGLQTALAMRGVEQACLRLVAVNALSRRWGPVAGVVSLPELIGQPAVHDGLPAADLRVFHRALRLSKRSGVPLICVGTEAETRVCAGRVDPVCLRAE